MQGRDRHMGHLEVPQFLGLLVVILGGAKGLGALAQRLGQPAVLGELVAGVVLGRSVLGLVDPQTDVLHLLAELGVIILLFEIGLETNLRQLLQVGGAATVVAPVGVALPFALGYAVCWTLGFHTLVAVVAGATLTATSVGITARVLADLGHFFVPLFFVTVGAAVDVGVLNPLEPGNRPTLLIGGLLILVAVVGKFLAGYAPVWFQGNKKVIGVGHDPAGRGGPDLCPNRARQWRIYCRPL